ncbi:MAG TPA: 6-phosphofructokinase [Syntrophobacteraceae bacterium]|nr:6-phosphofructokinase [Syntrophobacteraceae bacterium]
MVKTLAVMTSGGDAPGMNAAVRAVVRRALDNNLAVFGIYNGYEGLVSGGEALRALDWDSVGGLLQKGGTFLGTARSDRFRSREGRRHAVLNLLQNDIHALVVIGGDGSLSGASVLAKEWPEHVAELRRDGLWPAATGAQEGIPLQVIGLPGSIDNDLFGTDMCIGADTALNHVVRAMDNLSSTAASHQRTFVVETMGRHCGYLALMAALAGDASWVLVPEEELGLRWHQKMVEEIEQARRIGRPHQLVVVAEGAKHADGLPIRSEDISKILGERLKIDVRLTVLGHVQRGGSPTAYDRILATRLGAAAVDFLVRQPDITHRHMLGIQKNVVVATDLDEVVEKSRAVGVEIENGNYSQALSLRGESFRNTLALVKTLSRITPAKEARRDMAVVILTDGADAPGMNAAVSVAARSLMNQGYQVLAARDAFLGLIQGNFMELDWHDLVGWVGRPGSEIGMARHELVDDDFITIAQNLARRQIKGIVAVGGWDTYLRIATLAEQREHFEELQIPMVLVPASIDNNLPCTDFCIGADTALNNIVEALDKIRHTAGATRRAFIVEVMGRECGFLALMGALSTGAEKAYLPEKGITLAGLNHDVENLKRSFECGKRMVIFLRNENSSRHYTTDFLRRLMEEEGKGQFEVRTAILGHLQRGGLPSAFDRILASRLGSAAAMTIQQMMGEGSSEIRVLGLRGRGIAASSLVQAYQEMDIHRGRPRQQWFMELVEVADALAKHAPVSVAASFSEGG